MQKSKKIWLLFLGLISLLVSSLVACDNKPAGYATYTNKAWGYDISYPSNWQLEITEDEAICVIKAPSGRASVQIYVAEPIMTAQDAARRWTMALGTAWSELTLLKNEPRQDFWGWYLSYDYDTGYGLYHGEAYFKQTEKYLYKVDTVADVVSYNTYPFTTVISTFKLR